MRVSQMQVTLDVEVWMSALTHEPPANVLVHGPNMGIALGGCHAASYWGGESLLTGQGGDKSGDGGGGGEVHCDLWMCLNLKVFAK